MTATDAVGGGRRWGVPSEADDHRFLGRPARERRPLMGLLAGERRLVSQACEGSEEAVERLFQATWPQAYRAAYLIARDAGAAEDIAQEAFLSAVRALDRFDRRRPFGPWLRRIVVNRAIDFARAREIRAEVALEGIGEPGTDERVEPVVSDELHRAILGLELEQRTCVVLRYLLDWTPGEIAELLGIPRGTVNSRLRRALDRLAQTLEEGGG